MRRKAPVKRMLDNERGLLAGDAAFADGIRRKYRYVTLDQWSRLALTHRSKDQTALAPAATTYITILQQLQLKLNVLLNKQNVLPSRAEVAMQRMERLLVSTHTAEADARSNLSLPVHSQKLPAAHKEAGSASDRQDQLQYSKEIKELKERIVSLQRQIVFHHQTNRIVQEKVVTNHSKLDIALHSNDTNNNNNKLVGQAAVDSTSITAAGAKHFIQSKRNASGLLGSMNWHTNRNVQNDFLHGRISYKPAIADFVKQIAHRAGEQLAGLEILEKSYYRSERSLAGALSPLVQQGTQVQSKRENRPQRLLWRKNKQLLVQADDASADPPVQQIRGKLVVSVNKPIMSTASLQAEELGSTARQSNDWSWRETPWLRPEASRVWPGMDKSQQQLQTIAHRSFTRIVRVLQPLVWRASMPYSFPRERNADKTSSIPNGADSKIPSVAIARAERRNNRPAVRTSEDAAAQRSIEANENPDRVRQSLKPTSLVYMANVISGRLSGRTAATPKYLETHPTELQSGSITNQTYAQLRSMLQHPAYHFNHSGQDSRGDEAARTSLTAPSRKHGQRPFLRQTVGSNNQQQMARAQLPILAYRGERRSAGDQLVGSYERALRQAAASSQTTSTTAMIPREQQTPYSKPNADFSTSVASRHQQFETAVRHRQSDALYAAEQQAEADSRTGSKANSRAASSGQPAAGFVQRSAIRFDSSSESVAQSAAKQRQLSARNTRTLGQESPVYSVSSASAVNAANSELLSTAASTLNAVPPDLQHVSGEPAATVRMPDRTAIPTAVETAAPQGGRTSAQLQTASAASASMVQRSSASSARRSQLSIAEAAASRSRMLAPKRTQPPTRPQSAMAMTQQTLLQRMTMKGSATGTTLTAPESVDIALPLQLHAQSQLQLQPQKMPLSPSLEPLVFSTFAQQSSGRDGAAASAVMQPPGRSHAAAATPPELQYHQNRPQQTAAPAAGIVRQEQPAELDVKQIQQLVMSMPQLQTDVIVDKVYRALEKKIKFDQRRRGY